MHNGTCKLRSLPECNVFSLSLERNASILLLLFIIMHASFIHCKLGYTNRRGLEKCGLLGKSWSACWKRARARKMDGMILMILC